jgi:thiol-disulfide isomerase/thioredoxin
MRAIGVRAVLAGCLLILQSAGCDRDVAKTNTEAARAEAKQRPHQATKPGADEPAADQAAARLPLRVLEAVALRAEIEAAGRKATLVNLWASWCGSCKQEIPMLLEVAGGMEQAGVGIVFVSADEPEARDTAVSLLREHGVALPSVAMGGGVSGYRRGLDARWKGAIPATFLLDAEARVR